MREIEKIIKETVLKNTYSVGTRYDVPVYELESDPEDLIFQITTALSDKVVSKEEVEDLLGLLLWTAGGERALNSIKKYMNKHNMEKMTSEKFQELEGKK